jgi:hypothetical protein
MGGDQSRSAVKQPCTGEAHSNAYIDNCMSCAPHWGYYYACPSCTGKLDAKGVCKNGDCVCGGDRFTLPR